MRADCICRLCRHAQPGRSVYGPQACARGRVRLYGVATLPAHCPDLDMRKDWSGAVDPDHPAAARAATAAGGVDRA